MPPVPPRYLLGQLAASEGLTEPFVVPSFAPTAAQARELERITRRLLAEWGAAVREVVIPAYREAVFPLGGAGSHIGSSIGNANAVEQLNAAMTRATQRTLEYSASTPATLRTHAHFERVAQWHQARFVQAVQARVGVSVAPMMSRAAAENVIALATRRHVALIKGLDAEIAKKIETAVYDAMQGRFPLRDLRARLTKDLGFAPGRAHVIARDQIAKYTGALDRFRMEEAGVSKFVWVYTYRSKEPREHHIERNGKVYSWDDLPEDGAPGDAIGCQCRAQAYVEPTRR